MTKNRFMEQQAEHKMQNASSTTSTVAQTMHNVIDMFVISSGSRCFATETQRIWSV